ncbi:cytoplasmic tRNA 2-thiolation protein 2 [Bombina bombina]|uniref:cytoplasmic tRNA 2-thiolation protein 2 n=1 Tax=Bombina bombina TaxID=8345 RepID=UPI00235AB034|nr:cytoplasmic tRNA 2-thiolation protein 2 [Bombina bombina]
MCEVEESYSEYIQEKEQKKNLAQTCMKCKEQPAALIIRVGDAFCKSCFKEYFVHKFRAMLGKNRIVYPGEKVLLAYSGGPSSSAMIQQVQEGLSREAPKKLRFHPGILFIDEGAVCGQSWEERQRTSAEVQSVLEKTAFPYRIIQLEQVFSLPGTILQRNPSEISAQRQNYKQAVGSFIGEQASQSDTLEKLAQLSTADTTAQESSDTLPDAITTSCPPEAFTQQLIQLFTSTKTLTAKQELLHTLRTHLILHTARSCGYSKVMSGESCTRLSVHLLSNISLGRGAFLPLDTGFADNRFGDVSVIRPMREYSLKEISFYNRLFQVPSIFIPALDTKAPENGSIQRLSETFIAKLQEDFPSTVSTVYRTSEKLNLSSMDPTPENGPQDRCLLCLCPLDTHVGAASAFHATQVSQHLSQKQTSKHIDLTNTSGKSCCKQGQCCGNSENSTSCHTRVSGVADLVHALCYSCRLTVKDMQTTNVLPQYILQEAEHRNRRNEMKKEIQEFLLENV